MLEFIRVTPTDYVAGFRRLGLSPHESDERYDNVYRIVRESKLIGYVEIAYQQADVPELFGIPSMSIILHNASDYYGDTDTLSDMAVKEVFKLYEQVYWENRYPCSVCTIKEISAYGKVYFIADRSFSRVRDAGSNTPAR